VPWPAGKKKRETGSSAFKKKKKCCTLGAGAELSTLMNGAQILALEVKKKRKGSISEVSGKALKKMPTSMAGRGRKEKWQVAKREARKHRISEFGKPRKRLQKEGEKKLNPSTSKIKTSAAKRSKKKKNREQRPYYHEHQVPKYLGGRRFVKKKKKEKGLRLCRKKEKSIGSICDAKNRKARKSECMILQSVDRGNREKWVTHKVEDL